MQRAAAIALALAGGAAMGALLHGGEALYPVVRVSTPEGLVFTAFSGETRGRKDCDAANERFLEPIRAQCPACRLLSASCDSNEEAVARRVALSGPLVKSRGFTMAIAGPAELARAACEHLAKDLLKQGLEDSRCLPPRS